VGGMGEAMTPLDEEIIFQNMIDNNRRLRRLEEQMKDIRRQWLPVVLTNELTETEAIRTVLNDQEIK
jgi:hypothetical protein